MHIYILLSNIPETHMLAWWLQGREEDIRFLVTEDVHGCSHHMELGLHLRSSGRGYIVLYY